MIMTMMDIIMETQNKVGWVLTVWSDLMDQLELPKLFTGIS